jgi:hypothetical protein
MNEPDIEVRVVDSLLDGNCNACAYDDLERTLKQRRKRVYRILLRNLEFRVCQRCATELLRKLRTAI